MTADRSAGWWIAGVTVATALALHLRLDGLAVQSLWWDEVVTLAQTRDTLDQLIALTAADNYPPLHNLMVWTSLRLLGETEFALRLPSALLGAATVPLVYWTGARFGSRPAGVIAALLLAVSGFHIWYSQEARAYALLCFGAVAYGAAALAFAQRGGEWHGAVNVAAGAVLLYSHPYGALTFVPIAVALFLLLAVRRDTWGIGPVRFALVQVLPIVMFVPWALVLLGRAEAINTTGFWIPEVTPFRVLWYLMELLTGPLMLVAALVGIVLALRRPRDPVALAALGAWALGPLLIGTVLSWLSEPLVVQRYLIGSLPPILLLAGLGYVRLAAKTRPIALAALAFAAGVTFALGFDPPERPDFRSVAADLERRLQPSDCLAIWSWAWIGLDHYQQTEPACLLITEGGYTDVQLPTPQPGRIVVVLTPNEPTSNPVFDGWGSRGTLTSYGETRMLEITPS